MRKDGNCKLVFGIFCFIFLVAGNCNVLAGEQVEDVVSPSPEHIAAQPPSEPLDSPNSSESFRQSQQAIQEAQDLADLTDLREKALNSQPAAGQDSVFDSKYGNRSLIKH